MGALAISIENSYSDSIPEQDSSSDSSRDSIHSTVQDKVRLKMKTKTTVRKIQPKRNHNPPAISTSSERDQSESRLTVVSPVLSSLNELKKRFPHLDIGHGRRILKMNGDTVVAEDVPKAFRMAKTQKTRSLISNNEEQQVPAHKVVPKRRSITKNNNSNSSNNNDLFSSQDSKSNGNDPSYSPRSNKRPKRTVAQPQRVSSRATCTKTTPATSGVIKTKVKESKPGTAGSRQAVASTRRTKSSDISALLLLHNGRKIEPEKTPFKLIDTGCFVDETIIAFIPEIGQREQLDTIPRDPSRLCKPFSIVLPNCDVRDDYSFLKDCPALSLES